MSNLTLNKGQSLTLSKGSKPLEKVQIGLGWDEHAGKVAFDLDASAFCLARGKIFSESYFIFYNQLASPDNSIWHTGDDLTGGNSEDDDDEVINVNLQQLHPSIDEVAIAVSIHDADARRQNFGMVRNAYIRVVDDQTGAEVARYQLNEDFSMETAIVFGHLKRESSAWTFQAGGDSYRGGLLEICRKYGINL